MKETEVLLLFLCDEWKSCSSFSLIGGINLTDSNAKKILVKSIQELIKNKAIEISDKTLQLTEELSIFDLKNEIDTKITYLTTVTITLNDILTDGTMYC